MLLAAFLFLKRMSDVTQVTLVTDDLQERDESETRDMSKLTVPGGVEVFEIYGSLFFGAIERFKEAMNLVEKKPRVLIIRMRNVVAIDASGLQVMEELLANTRKRNISLLLSAVSAQPHEAMRQSGFLQRLGEDNIAPNIFDALDRARVITEAMPIIKTGPLL
jgi:SulP family sulfate permease